MLRLGWTDFSMGHGMGRNTTPMIADIEPEALADELLTDNEYRNRLLRRLFSVQVPKIAIGQQDKLPTETQCRTFVVTDASGS